MKKLIFDGLKTKFPGVQDAILDRIAAKMAKTVTKEEDVATSVEGVTFQQVLENYGDSRATEAQQTAVSTYEKKYNLKDGKVVEVQTQQTPQAAPSTEEVPKWAQEVLDTNKQLQESNKQLQQRLERFEGDKTTTARKALFTTAIEKLPEKLRQRYEKDFSRMAFKDDDEFNSYMDELKSDAEALSTELVTKKPYVPPMGSQIPNGEKPSAEVQARVDGRKGETGPQAIRGMPAQAQQAQ